MGFQSNPQGLERETLASPPTESECVHAGTWHVSPPQPLSDYWGRNDRHDLRPVGAATANAVLVRAIRPEAARKNDETSVRRDGRVVSFLGHLTAKLKQGDIR